MFYLELVAIHIMFGPDYHKFLACRMCKNVCVLSRSYGTVVVAMAVRVYHGVTTLPNVVYRNITYHHKLGNIHSLPVGSK